jgi:cytochrome c oxidase subunit IV
MAEHSEHVVPVKVYVAIWAALICLTLTTYGVAKIDLGQFNILVAMLIAGVKSTLVALFFMHAFYSVRRTKLVILASLAWLATLLLLTMGDYLSRPIWPPH